MARRFLRGARIRADAPPILLIDAASRAPPFPPIFRAEASACLRACHYYLLMRRHYCRRSSIDATADAKQLTRHRHAARVPPPFVAIAEPMRAPDAADIMLSRYAECRALPFLRSPPARGVIDTVVADAAITSMRAVSG